MTPPTKRTKTALERAEERRLAAMTPDERERLEAARKKLRARADGLLGVRPLGKTVKPTPAQVAQELEDLL